MFDKVIKSLGGELVYHELTNNKLLKITFLRNMIVYRIINHGSLFSRMNTIDYEIIIYVQVITC